MGRKLRDTPSDVPDVSVIVPAYDQPEMLREALDSVAAQDHADFEVLVVDDGSKVDLAPVLKRAREVLGARLRAFRQENAGSAAARNRGIAHATAPWVAFLDHDDRWRADRIRRQLEFASTVPEAALVFCQCREFGPASGDRVTPQRPAGAVTYHDLLEDTLIRTLSTVMIRRDDALLGACIGDRSWFDGRYRYANDIELYYRIAIGSEIQFLDEVLVEKRIHADQATRNRGESHDEVVAILEELCQGDFCRRERRRWAHHLARAAKAARDAGDVSGSRSRYRKLLRHCPGHLRAWRGYLGSFFD